MKKVLIILSIFVLLFAVGCTNAEIENIVGGDEDEHGCIPSAGYTWCEEKQKCLREWEEPCGEDINQKAMKFCGEPDVAGVYICGDHIKVLSSAAGAGITYYLADETALNCPVVSPESMSEECIEIILEPGCEEEEIC
jgi:hypothetical protein